MRRLPVAAFVALAIATVAAFFVTQHLKVTTPLIAGFPAPAPGTIDPVSGGVCKGVSHRSMSVSFYLLHRSDDVDVYIVNSDGSIVATLATGRHMRRGVRRPDGLFQWDGRVGGGAVAPDGAYYIKVSLIHQGRSVTISNNTGPEPVTVQTVPPRPRITRVSPALIPQPGGAGAMIRYTGNVSRSGRILIYRTDLPGLPRLVKSYASRAGGVSRWDGTISGRPAPQGTYLVGFKVTDKACDTGRFPPELPPVPGTTPHAGVTVRYLAAEPPPTPVSAGSTATVYVDALRHTYHWALRRAGAQKVLASGATHSFELRVPLPRGGPGLYELALRYGAHRTDVPLLARASGSHRAPVLVVLPALTWQGYNPVDDTGSGLPSTLPAGGPIQLNRPLANGLPAGLAGEAALLAHLQKAGLRYDLTSDVALTEGVGPALAGYRGVVLAGDERWLPAGLATSLRAYVERGGRVLSLGIDSLRREVTVSGGRALNPTGPRATDVLGATPGRVTASRGALILAGRDGLHIFSGTSGALRGYRTYQPFAPAASGAGVASEAGPSSSEPAIIAYHLGRGIVIDIGLPGFGSSLTRNFDAQQLVARIWKVLSG